MKTNLVGRQEQADDSGAVVKCPICHSVTNHFVTKTAQEIHWHVRKCVHCGHGFVSNRPSADFLRSYYSSSLNSHSHSATSPSAAESSVSWMSAVDALRLAGAPQSGSTLDVGSAYGGLASALSQAGYKPVLLDLSPEVVDLATTIPNAFGACCSFEDFSWHETFSIITMSQVLEHAIDPLGWLTHARQLIQPDGILMVSVPNFGGVYRLLGQQDPFICPPEHLNFFTIKSLKKAFQISGFTISQMRTSSRVVTAHHARRYSSLRWAAAQVWNNTACRLLDRTPFGIIVTITAKPCNMVP
jgi:2-polyprenyl-3-methyl-5-hydroxy-6-metoxy-1,4-benzoquinol methylase